MNAAVEEYVLVAKRCPSCESLVMARIEHEENGETRYADYRCSRCDWQSPVRRQD
jgi:hypothetical protein